MKKKLIKPFAILLAVFLGLLEVGWRFFNMVVCCKRGEHKKERKKWFELSHIRENHPRNGYARVYNESKAWCLEQKMQDCYIKSIDGLKLHALYLPAEDAKRIVILSHGYRGSRFGTLSFMAKYLHEHQCDVLFIEHRCCGDSEGKYITFGAKEQWDASNGQSMYLNETKRSFHLYGQSMGAAAVLMASGHMLPAEVKA
ncbi:MAG: alpha/beta hydrolase [Anaerobutyricum soehngenii]